MEVSAILVLFLLSTSAAYPIADGDQVDTASLENGPKSEPVSDGNTDDRIGLNFNRGHAVAYGPHGVSGSDSNTYGVQVGIRRPGNIYTPLYSQTGGRGSSYSSGPGAPQTWAHGNTQLGNGYTGGNSGAGFNGGHGIAQTNSFTQHIEIPLDPFGTVLYHNLKEKKHGNGKVNSTPSQENKANP